MDGLIAFAEADPASTRLPRSRWPASFVGGLAYDYNARVGTRALVLVSPELDEIPAVQEIAQAERQVPNGDGSTEADVDGANELARSDGGRAVATSSTWTKSRTVLALRQNRLAPEQARDDFGDESFLVLSGTIQIEQTRPGELHAPQPTELLEGQVEGELRSGV